ncbi:MAG: hypothetical protein AB7V62_11215 [Thermoleophilia bacterium]
MPATQPRAAGVDASKRAANTASRSEQSPSPFWTTSTVVVTGMVAPEATGAAIIAPMAAAMRIR